MKFKKIILSLALIGTLLVGCSSSGENTTSSTEASTENKVEDNETEEKPLPKISVASVAMSQVLDAMNIDIVGRPTTKLPLPKRYENISEIGSSHSPDFEKILAVETELLIGDVMFKDKLEKPAEEYKIDTFFANTSTYHTFTDSIKSLGEKISREEEANTVIKTINAPLEKYKDMKTDKKIAIIFGTSESNMLATKDSYIGSLVEVLGAKNIANEIIEKNPNALEQAKNGYLNLNIEQILENQPDMILRFGHGNIEEANKSFEKLFSENPAWKNLDAVKNNAIYDLDSSIFGVSANLKMGEALETLGDIIYETK